MKGVSWWCSELQECTCGGYTPVISDGWTGEVEVSSVGDLKGPGPIGVAGPAGSRVAQTVKVLQVGGSR